MEQEVRNILQSTLAAEASPTNGLALAMRIHQRFEGLSADQMPAPERAPARAVVATQMFEEDFEGIDQLTVVNPWQSH